MVNAHDLLWGMTPAHVPADAPAWVLEALGAGHPPQARGSLVMAGEHGHLYGAIFPIGEPFSPGSTNSHEHFLANHADRHLPLA